MNKSLNETNRAAGPRWLPALIFGLALASYFFWTFGHELWNPDETREGGIVWAMVQDHNLVAPHLNGRAFLEKPPLYYWSSLALVGLSGRLDAGTARLPAVIYGLLGAALTMLIGMKLFGTRTGLIAGAILALTPKYYITSHFALTDLPLTFFVYLAYYGFIGQEPARTDSPLSRSGLRALFVLAAAGAFLSKGLVGPVLIGAGLFFYLLAGRRFREMLILAGFGGAGLAPAAGLWLYALWRQGGTEFLRVFLIENHFGRFTQAALGHQHWFGYYLYIFPAVFLPWTIPLIPAGFWAYQKRRSEEAPAVRLLASWFLAGFVLLSLSSSKREIYLLPLFAPAAVLIARWLDELWSGRPLAKGEEAVLRTMTIIAAIAPAGLAATGAYFYPGRPLWIILPALPALAGIILAVLYLKRREMTGLIMLPLVVSIYMMAASSAVVEGPLDEDRSFKPLMTKVAGELQPGAALFGLHLSEMEEGAANFYLGYTFPNGPDPQALAAFLQDRRGTVYVLLDDKEYKSNREPLRRFDPVFSFPVGQRRPHTFLLLRGPAGT